MPTSASFGPVSENTFEFNLVCGLKKVEYLCVVLQLNYFQSNKIINIFKPSYVQHNLFYFEETYAVIDQILRDKIHPYYPIIL